MTARDRLDQLDALTAATTPPTGGTSWVVEHSWRSEVFTGPLSGESRDVGQFDEVADAEFTVAARTAVPQLVTALRAVLDLRPNHAESCRCGACTQHRKAVHAIDAALEVTQ